MFEAIFGTEMPLVLRFFIAFLIVLALIGGSLYLVRRFGVSALKSAAGGRGRQPRLAVIDHASRAGFDLGICARFEIIAERLWMNIWASPSMA